MAAQANIMSRRKKKKTQVWPVQKHRSDYVQKRGDTVAKLHLLTVYNAESKGKKRHMRTVGPHDNTQGMENKGVALRESSESRQMQIECRA